MNPAGLTVQSPMRHMLLFLFFILFFYLTQDFSSHRDVRRKKVKNFLWSSSCSTVDWDQNPSCFQLTLIQKVPPRSENPTVTIYHHWFVDSFFSFFNSFWSSEFSSEYSYEPLLKPAPIVASPSSCCCSTAEHSLNTTSDTKKSLLTLVVKQK